MMALRCMDCKSHDDGDDDDGTMVLVWLLFISDMLVVGGVDCC